MTGVLGKQSCLGVRLIPGCCLCRLQYSSPFHYLNGVLQTCFSFVFQSSSIPRPSSSTATSFLYSYETPIAGRQCKARLPRRYPWAEAKGVPSKQAEAITSAITEVLNDSLENVAQSFVSKSEMQKSDVLQESNLSNFKSEVQSSQEHHFSLLQRETEKLRSDIEKMRSGLRYEIDKVTDGQRLDLNLERGRIRDELANQNAETTNLTNKLDREIHD